MERFHVQLRFKELLGDWELTVGSDVSMLFGWQARELYATVMAAVPGDVQIGPLKLTVDAAQLARIKDYFSMFEGALA